MPGTAFLSAQIDKITSQRRNPIIADLFHRMRYMEQRGSGLRKIVNETAKLPGYTESLCPTFYSTPSSFTVVIKNVNYNMGGSAVQVAGHDTRHDTGHDDRTSLLLSYCSEPRSREEMQAFVGLTSRTYFQASVLKPLLESGKLKMTVPEKPKSKNQKYIKA